MKKLGLILALTMIASVGNATKNKRTKSLNMLKTNVSGHNCGAKTDGNLLSKTKNQVASAKNGKVGDGIN